MAVLQIEWSRPRLTGYEQGSYQSERAEAMFAEMLRRSLMDTIRNGGTFVVVVTDTTITAVQHEDAKPLEGE